MTLPSMLRAPLLAVLLMVFSFMAHANNLRVDAATLNQALATQQYAILDARATTDYRKGHIVGAQNFPIDWTYERKKENGRIIEPGRIQIILRNLGLDVNTPIVVYDDGALVDAARLFWTLEVYGFKQVKILNVGFDTWLSQDYPTTTEVPKVAASQYVPVINHQRLATKFATQIATKNPNQLIIDARPNPAYLGEMSSAKRYGHIPKAINIPASHNLAQDDEFKSLQSVDALKKVYQAIPKDKKIILYCAIGRISSANYLALRELGYDVANYDASWKEWGNDFNLPIINPSDKAAP